jgi:hypothetical protein
VAGGVDVVGVDEVDVVGHAEEEAVDESAAAARTALEVKAKMARMLGANFILG